MSQIQPFQADFSQPLPRRSKVAERLLVHARICHQMACASLDEAAGERLQKMADACNRDAAEMIASERAAEI